MLKVINAENKLILPIYLFYFFRLLPANEEPQSPSAHGQCDNPFIYIQGDFRH